MANIYTSNGWDIIAASTQSALNAQLAKMGAITINQDVPISADPNNPSAPSINIQLSIELSAPQISILSGSGRMVNVLFTVSGSMLWDGFNVLTQPQQATMTTSLAMVEAELASQSAGPNTTSYDLYIDLQNASALNFSVNSGTPGILSLVENSLIIALKQDIGDAGKQYKVASFTLANDVATSLESHGLLPHSADFSFIQNTTDPDRSNFLVLMLSLNEAASSSNPTDFAEPLLPPGQDFMVLISNQIFLQYTVLPAVQQQIQNMPTVSSTASEQIALQPLSGQQYLYQIQNNGNIALNMDHNPWIAMLNISIDTSTQALYSYIDGQANATFLNIHVDTWAKTWDQITVDSSGNIGVKQINSQNGGSTDLDWWEWFLGALTGPIGLIVEGVIYGIAKANVPNLSGSFASIASETVKWPYQEAVAITSIGLPNHVVVNIQPQFSDWAGL